MTEKSKYNATNDQVKVPKIDEQYIADLRASARAAREAFQKASARFEVLSETSRQARAR